MHWDIKKVLSPDNGPLQCLFDQSNMTAILRSSSSSSLAANVFARCRFYSDSPDIWRPVKTWRTQWPTGLYCFGTLSVILSLRAPLQPDAVFVYAASSAWWLSCLLCLPVQLSLYLSVYVPVCQCKGTSSLPGSNHPLYPANLTVLYVDSSLHRSRPYLCV